MNDPYDSTPTIDMRHDAETLEKHAKIRKSTLLIVFVLSALLFLIVFYQNRPQPGYITVGAIEGQYASLIWVAEARGYFEYNNVYVEVRKCKTTSQCMNWLQSGSIDVAVTDDYMFASRLSEAPDLRAFSSLGEFESTEIIYDFKKGFGSLQELKDLEVGVPSDSLSEYWFYQSITDLGMDISDYKVIDTDPYDITQNIRNGEIFAGVAWNPIAYGIKDELSHKAVYENLQKGEPNYWLLVSDYEYLESNHELARRFLASLFEAENFIVTNPQESKAIIAEMSGFDTKYVEDVWDSSYIGLSLSSDIVYQVNFQQAWRVSNRLQENYKELSASKMIYTSLIEKVKPQGLLAENN